MSIILQITVHAYKLNSLIFATTVEKKKRELKQWSKWKYLDKDSKRPGGEDVNIRNVLLLQNKRIADNCCMKIRSFN